MIAALPPKRTRKGAIQYTLPVSRAAARNPKLARLSTARSAWREWHRGITDAPPAPTDELIARQVSIAALNELTTGGSNV